MPPQNLEAEMAVLGSMLIEETAISYAVEMLDGASFYNDSNRRIFEGIVKLYGDNKAVDMVTLIEELKKTGDLDKVGGSTYIANLTTVVPTAANERQRDNRNENRLHGLSPPFSGGSVGIRVLERISQEQRNIAENAHFVKAVCYDSASKKMACFR